MHDTYFIHVFDIDWDTYDEDSGKTLDPKELGLPNEVIICNLTEEMYHDIIDDEEGIADHLSDMYGWCIGSFCTDEYTGDNPNVEKIIKRLGEKYVI